MEEGSSATDSITDVTDVTHILHHSQLAFYEQAFRPVPQANLYFVEQASYLLLTMVQDIRCNECQEEGKGKREEARRKRENYSLFQLKT